MGLRKKVLEILICNQLKICKSDFHVTMGLKNNFLTFNLFHCNFAVSILNYRNLLTKNI